MSDELAELVDWDPGLPRALVGTHLGAAFLRPHVLPDPIGADYGDGLRWHGLMSVSGQARPALGLFLALLCSKKISKPVMSDGFLAVRGCSGPGGGEGTDIIAFNHPPGPPPHPRERAMSNSFNFRCPFIAFNRLKRQRSDQRKAETISHPAERRIAISLREQNADQRRRTGGDAGPMTVELTDVWGPSSESWDSGQTTADAVR